MSVWTLAFFLPCAISSDSSDQSCNVDTSTLLQKAINVNYDSENTHKHLKLHASTLPSYGFGEAGTNDCPVGFENILTRSDCQDAGQALGVNEDYTHQDARHGDSRPKGCFSFEWEDGLKYLYLNPNPSVPSKPWDCFTEGNYGLEFCRPICKSVTRTWEADTEPEMNAAINGKNKEIANKNEEIANKNEEIANKDQVIFEMGAFAPGPGWCDPWGSDGGDLCREYPNQASCSTVDSGNYLPKGCDESCARQACLGDSYCVGYTYSDYKKAFKLKSQIDSSSYQVGGYMCFRKIT